MAGELSILASLNIRPYNKTCLPIVVSCMFSLLHNLQVEDAVVTGQIAGSGKHEDFIFYILM